MAQPAIQTSFNAGEFAPALNARVDLGKYHSAAALLRNFYVDYRGGASTRSGTKYVIEVFDSSKQVRLIPFQASFTVSYVLEFGNYTIRFIANGAPVLETGFSVQGTNNAIPGVIQCNGNNFNVGDWVYVTGIVGATQWNNKYYIIASKSNAGNNIALNDLRGNPIDATGFGAYISGGLVQRVYTISSPYASTDLSQIKFAQNVTSLILCHPNYAPYVLTISSAASWSMTAIRFGSALPAPGSVAVASTLGAGNWTYGYAVTAVDANGQESTAGAATLGSLTDLFTNEGTNTVTWSAVSGAVSYNIYKTTSTNTVAIASGAAYGFAGNVTGTTFNDSYPGVGPDFSQTIPIAQNPFQGASVQSITLTAHGTYTTVPSVTLAAPPGGGIQATAYATLTVVSSTVNTAGINYNPTNTIFLSNGITIQVDSIDSFGGVVTYHIVNTGSVSSGNVPGNPVGQQSSSGAGTLADFNLTWGVGSVVLFNPGAGYATAPAVTFSSGAATATATLGSASAGNPSVPGFFQQRLVLAAPNGALQTFYMSQPGSFYNFNISNPTQADDAITGSIISGQLNQIKSLVSVPTGLIALTSRAAWLLNGGGAGIAITPANATANSQAFNGASDLPPILVNFDVLYGQAKGSFIRNLTYNFYANIYTGTDISVLSSHLFYGYQINEWAWSEEPFKIVWAVRNDGKLLSLTFVKEQDLIGWAHSDTLGLFKSVCTVTESTSFGSVDAVYTVVQRQIAGSTVQYIERMAERIFPYGVEDAWCVDAALQSVPTAVPQGTLVVAAASGNNVLFTATPNAGTPNIFANNQVGWVIRVGGGIATITSYISPTQVRCNITQAITNTVPNDPNNTPVPAMIGQWTLWTPSTTFTGLDHLDGATVTGLADGAVIPPTVVANGQITLAQSATKVTVGLAFTPQLQTLQIDLGEPTVQGKRKKITAVTARCQDTLGLSIGKSFSSLVQMKDLVIGNVGSATDAPVTGLVTADARTIIDPLWDVPGQYCFQQSNPLPATILGVMPEIVVGDTK